MQVDKAGGPSVIEDDHASGLSVTEEDHAGGPSVVQSHENTAVLEGSRSP